MTDELREKLAEYAHSAWSGWMKYMFSCEMDDEDCGRSLPGWTRVRWQRQMTTEYADLPESEKESDRDQADAILAIVNARIAALEAELAEAKRWRSVEESIPDDGIEVLIWTSEGATIGAFNHNEDPCIDGEIVNWWRPLPDGPEEK